MSAGGESDDDGLLLVLSGPSGVGKTTVAEGLLENPGYSRAVTATTRRSRDGEEDGRDYHFLDEETFRRRVADGRFLEHAVVHGRLYGTPREGVERVLEAGLVCLLVIDVQGAASLREQGVPALFVFLAPPSEEMLEARLRGRGSEEEQALQARLAQARAELARQDEYDAVVINDDVTRAIGEIEGLVRTRPGNRSTTPLPTPLTEE